MHRVLYWILVSVIGIFVLCCAYISSVLVTVSGVIFEQDNTDVQTKLSTTEGLIVFVLGLAGLSLSFLLAFKCKRIADFVVYVQQDKSDQ
jgi:hypothetical protein